MIMNLGSDQKNEITEQTKKSLRHTVIGCKGLSLGAVLGTHLEGAPS